MTSFLPAAPGTQSEVNERKEDGNGSADSAVKEGEPKHNEVGRRPVRFSPYFAGISSLANHEARISRLMHARETASALLSARYLQAVSNADLTFARLGLSHAFSIAFPSVCISLSVVSISLEILIVGCCGVERVYIPHRDVN